jgi:hypothetical protein
MPTLAYSDPQSERRSYEFHDPLPESQVGPLVERPREAIRQRSEPRRTIDHTPFEYRRLSADMPPVSRYPDVVRP